MSRETIILHLLFDQIKKGHTNIFWNLEDRRAKHNHFLADSVQRRAPTGLTRPDHPPICRLEISSFQFNSNGRSNFFLHLTFVVPSACVKSPLSHDLLISAPVSSNKREPQFPPIICLARQFLLIFNKNYLPSFKNQGYLHSDPNLTSLFNTIFCPPLKLRIFAFSPKLERSASWPSRGRK